MEDTKPVSGSNSIGNPHGLRTQVGPVNCTLGFVDRAKATNVATDH